MGASGWNYWVNYSEDIDEVFEALREEVFAAGDYAKPWNAPDDYHPASIKELIHNCAEEGTHSILDIANVSTEPLDDDSDWKDELQTLFPLTRRQLRRLFDTTEPTREEIEEKQFELQTLDMARWSGRWIVAYENEEPVEYYIFGCSGD